MMIEGVFEVAMLLCFAAAWPLNIIRFYRARTTRGISLPFSVVVEIGYVCGIINHIVNNDVNYVVGFYTFNIVLVGIGIAIYFRNMRIEKIEKRTGRC